MSEDEIILTHILKCRRIDLHVNNLPAACLPAGRNKAGPVLTPEQQQQFDEFTARRRAGEPLQYILGVAHFYGFGFKVNPAVLVPRPETEILVEEALRRFKGETILDIGTGSGCIAVTLAKHLPQAKVTAIDVSVDALAVARENARAHGVEDRIDFVQMDILGPPTTFGSPRYEGIKAFGGDNFDLIISNPPYIPSSQMTSLPKDVQQEPRLALDGGEDGLKFYRALIKNSPFLLKKGACLMMEFGDACLPAGRGRVTQSEAIQALLQQAGCSFHVDIMKDLTGRDRICSAIKE